MVESKKTAQADKAFKDGERALATGLLKWSPDYALGSMKFEEAAKIYKNQGDKQKAI